MLLATILLQGGNNGSVLQWLELDVDVVDLGSTLKRSGHPWSFLLLLPLSSEPALRTGHLVCFQR